MYLILVITFIQIPLQLIFFLNGFISYKNGSDGYGRYATELTTQS